MYRPCRLAGFGTDDRVETGGDPAITDCRVVIWEAPRNNLRKAKSCKREKGQSVAGGRISVTRLC
jgi:hypothetical protein